MGCLWNLLTWPFQLAANLIGLILGAVGRLTAFILGLIICGGGVALCLTIVGAILGIPMIVFGGGLMIRSIFCRNRKTCPAGSFPAFFHGNTDENLFVFALHFGGSCATLSMRRPAGGGENQPYGQAARQQH